MRKPEWKRLFTALTLAVVLTALPFGEALAADAKAVPAESGAEGPSASGETVLAEKTVSDSLSNNGTITDSSTRAMYRLYNPVNGEHFYTDDIKERGVLLGCGWRYEGIGWYVPAKSNTPVYRLYNLQLGIHFYTRSIYERTTYEAAGWIYEGIGWYSDDTRSFPVYREYNPNSKGYNYTTNSIEHATLIRAGWVNQSIAWYATDTGVRPNGDRLIVDYTDVTVSKGNTISLPVTYAYNGTVYFSVANSGVCTASWSSAFRNNVATLSIKGVAVGTTYITFTNSIDAEKQIIKVTVTK